MSAGLALATHEPLQLLFYSVTCCEPRWGPLRRVGSIRWTGSAVTCFLRPAWRHQDESGDSNLRLVVRRAALCCAVPGPHGMSCGVLCPVARASAVLRCGVLPCRALCCDALCCAILDPKGQDERNQDARTRSDQPKTTCRVRDGRSARVCRTILLVSRSPWSIFSRS